MFLFIVNLVGWLATATLGLVYPALCSIYALESLTGSDDTQWLTYWLIFSLYTMFETLVWAYLKWVPLYYILKALLTAWVVLPQFKGAAYIYETAIHPVYLELSKAAEKNPNVKKFIEKVTGRPHGIVATVTEAAHSAIDAVAKRDAEKEKLHKIVNDVADDIRGDKIE